MKIELVSREAVTIETYKIVADGNVYFYKDYLNEKGKAIDSTLQNEEGYEVYDAAMMEAIQEEIT